MPCIGSPPRHDHSQKPSDPNEGAKNAKYGRLAAAVLMLAGGCTASNSSALPGGGCSVVDNSDRTATLICADGTSAPFMTGTETPLVRIDAEPPGENCAAGGFAIKTGIDTDDNTTLGDSEVRSISYVCDGATGSDGKSGQSALVRLEVEPAGVHCVQGGTAVKSGIDLDKSGILDDLEVTSTTYVCNPALIPNGILQGSVVIHNSLDVLLLSQVTEITGDLTIDAPGLSAVDLPLLKSIGRGLRVEAADKVLATLNLPELTTIGGGLVLQTTGISTLGLPKLATVGSYVWLTNNTLLSSFSVPALTSIGGALYFVGNDSVPELFFPSLNSIGPNESLRVSHNANLQTLLLPALTKIESFVFVYNNPSLTTFSADLLTSVGTFDLHFGQGFQVIFNDALTTLSLPALSITGNFEIRENGSLRALNFPKLLSTTNFAVTTNTQATSASIPVLATVNGSFDVSTNLRLRQCLVDALLAQLSSPPTSVTTMDNSGTPNICP